MRWNLRVAALGAAVCLALLTGCGTGQSDIGTADPGAEQTHLAGPAADSGENGDALLSQVPGEPPEGAFPYALREDAAYFSIPLAVDCDLASSISAYYANGFLYSLQGDSRQILRACPDGSDQQYITPELAEDELIGGICIRGDTLWLAVCRWQSIDDRNSYTTERISGCSLDGKVIETVFLPALNCRVRALCMDQTGNFVLATSEDELVILAPSGALLGVIQDCAVQNLAVLEDGTVFVYHYSQDGQDLTFKLDVLDPDRMVLTGDYPLLNGESRQNMTMLACGDRLLFSTSPDDKSQPYGVYVFDVQAQTYTLLSAWEAVGLEERVNIPMAAASADCFWAVSFQPGTGAMEALQITTTAPPQTSDAASEKQTVTLGCWETDAYLTALVNGFNKQSQEYQVQLRAYCNLEQPENGADRMTAELLAGDRADVYCLMNLDGAAMAKAGLLADLKPLLEQEGTEACLWNILNLWETDGHLYQLAPYCTLDALVGDRDTVPQTGSWTWAEFESFCSDLPEGAVPIRGVSRDDMLRLCAWYAQRDFLDEETGQCWFDNGEFACLLEFAAGFSEEADLLTDEEITAGACALLPWGLSGVEDFQRYRHLYPNGFSLIGYPSNDGSGVLASCPDTWAMGANCENPAGAWAFLQYLLGERCQEQVYAHMGFPVNRAALADLLRRATLPVNNADSWFRDTDAAPLTASETAWLQSTLEQVSARMQADEIIASIIQEEAAYFAAGTKTADAVAALIQSRVRLYLAERS